MDDDRLEDRRRAIVLAGYNGDPTIARSGLGSDEAELRTAALGALDRLDELATADLLAALRDPEPLVRSRAARIAATRGQAFPELVDLLSDPDSTIVEVAAFALGECADADGPTVEMLCRVATEHSDSLCREAATAALGALGRPESLDAVLHACGDKASVRRRAVLALAAFEGGAVTEMLEHMSGDRDLQVRQAAQELLSIEEGEAL